MAAMNSVGAQPDPALLARVTKRQITRDQQRFAFASEALRKSLRILNLLLHQFREQYKLRGDLPVFEHTRDASADLERYLNLRPAATVLPGNSSLTCLMVGIWPLKIIAAHKSPKPG